MSARFTPLVPLLFATILTVSVVPNGAQAGFVVCNKTPFQVSAGLGFDQGGSARFTGWKSLAPQSCETLIPEIKDVDQVSLFAYSEALVGGRRAVWSALAGTPPAQIPPGIPDLTTPGASAQSLPGFLRLRTRGSDSYTHDLVCDKNCAGGILQDLVGGIERAPVEAAPYEVALAIAKDAKLADFTAALERFKETRDTVVGAHDQIWSELQQDYQQNIAPTKGDQARKLYADHLIKRIEANRSAVASATEGGHVPLAIHYQTMVEADLLALEDLAPPRGAEARAQETVSLAELEAELANWKQALQTKATMAWPEAEPSGAEEMPASTSDPAS